MRARTLISISVALVSVAAFAGCSGDSSDSTTSGLGPPPAQDGLMVGLQDDRLAHPEQDPAPRFATIAGLDTDVVRLDLRWDLVAATARPANPTDPADPAYNWAHYDAIVDTARQKGITLVPTIYGTPQWAADTAPDAQAGGDPSYPAFGARPKDPQDAGDFAQAAAARYAPKGVRMWEAWNEPNIPLFLRPQWKREGGKWVPASPETYSNMLKAMYAGIKKSDPQAIVAGGVTAPNGDMPETPGGAPCEVASTANCRVTPQDFVKGLDADGLQPPMDVFSHHPYPIRPPSDAVNPGASYVDLYSLPVLEKILDEGYLRGKPLWLSEFGVATEPVANQPYSRPPNLQKADLADAIARVRKDDRVKTFIWYFLQDNPDWKSGLYDEAGKAKPAADEFRKAARGG